MKDAARGTGYGEWRNYRNTPDNLGFQAAPGDIKQPGVSARIFVHGELNANILYADINGDGVPELLLIDSGRICAIDCSGETIWKSTFVMASSIFRADDLDGDGKAEIFAVGDKSMIILDAQNGDVLHIGYVDSDIFSSRCSIADFDGDGRMELAFCVHKKPYIYIYQFGRDERNAFTCELIEKILDKRTEDEGNIAAFYPSTVVCDIDGDGYKELCVLRHAGLDVYDMRAILSLTSLTSEEVRQQVKQPVQSVEWWPEGASSGRNYGYFTMTDLDGSGYADAVIVANVVSLHTGVVNNDKGQLKFAWDEYYGYSGQPNEKNGLYYVMRSVDDPVCDINGDGLMEICQNLFEYEEESGVGTWSICIKNSSNGKTEHLISDYYLHGIVDVLGNQTKQLLVTKENAEKPQGKSPIEILYLAENGQFESMFSMQAAEFVFNTIAASEEHISPTGMGVYSRSFAFDCDHDGQQELMIKHHDQYECIKFRDAKNYDVMMSFDAELGSPFGFMHDSKGELILLLKGKNGILRAIDQGGSPLWEYISGGDPNLVPAVADIDQDGINEIIICANNMVICYRMIQGEPRKLWSVPGYGKLCGKARAMSAAICDMDGDGYLEIVVAHDKEGLPGIRVLDYSGREKWSYYFKHDRDGKVINFTAGAIKDIAIADFNGDGVPDIFCALQNVYPTGRSAIIDGSTKKLVYMTKELETVTNAEHGITNKRALLPAPIGSSAAVYDVDGDGCDEIMFVALETYVKLKYDKENGASLFTHVAQVSPQLCKIYYSVPIIANVGEGKEPYHIICSGFNSFSVFTNELPPKNPMEKPKMLWNKIMPVSEYDEDGKPKNIFDQDIQGRMQGIGDVDGDGNLEVCIQYTTGDWDQYKGYIYCYDADSGDTKWRYDLKPEFGENVCARDIITCDIDGDGLPEFIISTNTGYIAALSGKDDLVLQEKRKSRVTWKMFVGAGSGIPIAADIDGDGKTELLVAVEDGYIYIIGNDD
ncbi:FG-GAP-like repeat-containing protein [Paenibacillus solisilvae]|uniref:FG-GAP-like repeat-containing protein n=1 Tax=Paenibacillus solisilvae TaxID=2486751 RepID=A0ABW0W5Y0_9BACL